MKIFDSITSNKVSGMLDTIRHEMKYTAHLTGISSLSVKTEQALTNVLREKFVPPSMRACAYDDSALPLSHGQTISQPFIVALMTELLAVDDAHTVLEVGTGCGYQSAVLSLLARQVYSLEIVAALAAESTERLHKLHFDNVQVKQGDGYRGWPEHAPYDGIIVTAAAPALPEPLIGQLKVGGKMVLPIGLPNLHQELFVLEKDEKGDIFTKNVLPVAFVPLTRETPSETLLPQS